MQQCQSMHEVSRTFESREAAVICFHVLVLSCRQCKDATKRFVRNCLAHTL